MGGRCPVWPPAVYREGRKARHVQGMSHTCWHVTEVERESREMEREETGAWVREGML